MADEGTSAEMQESSVARLQRGAGLDTIDSKNATFVNFALIYNGGKLRLENVRFINCTFGVSDSTNLNVLKLLSAALSGQPINLELSDYEH